MNKGKVVNGKESNNETSMVLTQKACKREVARETN